MDQARASSPHVRTIACPLEPVCCEAVSSDMARRVINRICRSGRLLLTTDGGWEPFQPSLLQDADRLWNAPSPKVVGIVECVFLQHHSCLKRFCAGLAAHRAKSEVFEPAAYDVGRNPEQLADLLHCGKLIHLPPLVPV